MRRVVIRGEDQMESGFIIEDGKLIKPVGSVQSIIMIPHNVEVIGEYAFANLHDIEGIVLHDRVKEIEREGISWLQEPYAHRASRQCAANRE